MAYNGGIASGQGCGMGGTRGKSAGAHSAGANRLVAVYEIQALPCHSISNEFKYISDISPKISHEHV